ncbi:hypothetical protein Scep_011297 [Stephania cephalantha]|uniref:Uncharacterized protein n=1 Tax=Stephania cephalantha TaxID=152367 RepID=A0AAP0P6B8_9MAGN
MATVLELVTAPRQCGFGLAVSPKKVTSAALAISNCSKVSALCEFRGLKVQLESSRRIRASTRSIDVGSGGVGGGIVCEAQDTATKEVASVTD